MTALKTLGFAAFLGCLAVAQGVAQEVAAASGQTAEPAPEAVDPMAPLDGIDVNLSDFLWVARPIVVFADTPADPRFTEQMELLAERLEPLAERDVVIITDPAHDGRSALRQHLRPRGFAVVVMAKDGTVGLRRPSPRDVREIVRAIANFALRQEEIQRGG